MLARTVKQEAAADDVDPEELEKQKSEVRTQDSG
jgi:hypothetical protein